jgi:eukaryotic-like serine/threonine-protein kinase
VATERAGMGLESWKSPQMGESRSSALGRVIRAGHTALLTPFPGADDESTGSTTDERSGRTLGSTRSTILAGGRLVAARRPELEPVLGRYRLCRRLGAGAFGTVWLAWDERLERDVALKLLPRERIASGRFEREARAAARLNHPGIVVLYEAAVDDEGGYLVSELVRGHTLSRLLDNGRLSDRDVVSAAVALCDALEYAHRQGVVHRDVKPSNVLMPDSPSTVAEVAKLTDFGVARLVGGDSLTRTGDVLGTNAYMAPEQAAGREVEATADLYSLALVVYEALTGVNPVREYARGGRLGVHLPAVRRHRRDLPRELAYAVDLALRPRPRERGTVPELREALLATLGEVDDEPGVVTPSRAGPVAEDRVHPRLTAPASPTLTRALTPRPAPGSPGGPVTTRTTVRVVGGVGPLARFLAAISAAAATAWFASGVLSPSPVVPAVAVLATGLAVAVLPRVAWLLLTVCAALLLVEQGSPGGSIVLLAALLPTVILLLRHPGRSAFPAVVPALALIGLVGAWPALAGRASSAWERMVLGAAGWLWLVVGGSLSGQMAYVRSSPAIPPPRIWMPSLHAAVHQVLHPLLYSGILAPGLVWAGAALALPVIGARAGGTERAPAWATRWVLLLAWAGGLLLLTAGVLAVAAPGVTIRLGPALLGTFSAALCAGLGWPLARRGPRVSGSDAGPGLA